VWLRFAKTGPLRFVGHLDLARAFDRAVRRAGLPVAYTEGFNPRAKISFGPPLPLGLESECEVCAIDLAGPVSAAEFADSLAAQLPAGLRVLGAELRSRGRRSPVADITRAEHEAELVLSGVSAGDVAQAVAGLLAEGELLVCRAEEKRDVVVDLRPSIQALAVLSGTPARLSFALIYGSGPSARPSELLSLLTERLGREDAVRFGRIVRTALG
jgi:radical SAM-linked protein